MKKFQVISKKNCPRCEDLKGWLKAKNLKYEEWKIEDAEVRIRLMADEQFTQKFCDLDGCMVYTPVIRLDETGEYHFKELFNQMGIREKFVKELLQID